MECVLKLCKVQGNYAKDCSVFWVLGSVNLLSKIIDHAVRSSSSLAKLRLNSSPSRMVLLLKHIKIY